MISIIGTVKGDEVIENISRLLNAKILPIHPKCQPNGEIAIEFESKLCPLTTNLSFVRYFNNNIVFIIQGGNTPVDQNLFELLFLAQTARKSGAEKVVLVVRNFPYARQDKRDNLRAPISAKLIAGMMRMIPIDHLITVDLHAPQIEGFFDCSVDNLSSEDCAVSFIRKKFLKSSKEGEDLAIVSPDVGGTKRATQIADALGLPIAVIYKERKIANEVSRMVLIGSVSGKRAIIVDDMADTCGTLILAAKTLIESGKAAEVHAIVTHGIFSNGAIDKIWKSPHLTSLTVTNTIPLDREAKKCTKIHEIDISEILSKAIRKVYDNSGEF